MDIKPEILTSPSFFLEILMSDIEQRRRLRALVEGYYSRAAEGAFDYPHAIP